jgi:hypothetical protein
MTVLFARVQRRYVVLATAGLIAYGLPIGTAGVSPNRSYAASDARDVARLCSSGTVGPIS